jgi:hypothetical protein
MPCFTMTNTAFSNPVYESHYLLLNSAFEAFTNYITFNISL